MTLESATSTTILVVDDELPLLRLMSRVLEKAGHEVLTAVSGDHAMDVFSQNIDAIDGVLLDVTIPPRGVAEIMQAMTEARPDLAVLLASGDMLDPDVREQMEACGGLFLRKPFVPKLLIKTLGEAFANKERRLDAGEGR